METEDLLRERLDGPAPSLRGARVGVSEEVDAVVRRALARDPAQRYASAGAFARDLRAAVERGDATGVIGAIPRPLKGGRPIAVDATIALLAVLAVLLGTLIVFASFQGRTPISPTPSPARTGAASVTPNVVGKPAQDAIEQLLAAGFARVAYDVDSGASGAACSVARQEPASGASITREASAMIWYVPGRDCVKGKSG